RSTACTEDARGLHEPDGAFHRVEGAAARGQDLPARGRRSEAPLPMDLSLGERDVEGSSMNADRGQAGAHASPSTAGRVPDRSGAATPAAEGAPGRRTSPANSPKPTSPTADATINAGWIPSASARSAPTNGAAMPATLTIA